MSIHGDIQQQIRKIITDNEHVDILSPTWIAGRVVRMYDDEKEEHMSWMSREQCKAMARKILAAKFDEEGSESDSYQGDMFSGVLQQRYPIPRRADQEPMYKPRERLTESELAWNVEHLMKSADARVKHARALDAYRMRRFPVKKARRRKAA